MLPWSQIIGISLFFSVELVGEALTPELVAYIQEELMYDSIAIEDVDPKAFDYDPDKASPSQQDADYAAIKFIAKLLYDNQSQYPIAAVEKDAIVEEEVIVEEPEETFDQEDEVFVPGSITDSQGRIYEYEKPLPVMIQEGNRQVITHFPQQAIISQYETGEYVSEERPFYIARKPVTNREWKKFIKATARPAPPHWPKDKMSTAFKDEPVVNITHEEAAAYAAWMKKRLPTLGELQRAQHYFPRLLNTGPIREWTATPAKELNDHFLVEGGGEFPADTRDHQTGFRVAHFPD